MSKKKEFQLLKGANLKRIERDRWPPKWYEDEVMEYQKKLEEWQGKYGKGSVGSSGFFGRRKGDKSSVQGAVGNGQGQGDESGCMIM